MKRTNLHQLSIRLPHDLWERLNEQATRLNVPASNILSIALVNYLESQEIIRKLTQETSFENLIMQSLEQQNKKKN